MPIPPYIASKRAPDAQDASDYQTLFARETGSVAAPTAGLHFTPQLLDALEATGIARTAVTLHVNAGTFLPVKSEDISEHRMHAEHADLSQGSADAILAARAAGGRCIPIGTTALRTLESAAAAGPLAAYSAATSIFITPGYRFQGRGWPDDEFPSSQIDALHAGERHDGPRRNETRLRPRREGALSLFLLRRRLPAAALRRPEDG